MGKEKGRKRVVRVPFSHISGGRLLGHQHCTGIAFSWGGFIVLLDASTHPCPSYLSIQISVTPSVFPSRAMRLGPRWEQRR